ncbi:MAG: S8 family serine peptidase [bacterium]|nr:S8 family serine peptidase [bacterium]
MRAKLFSVVLAASLMTTGAVGEEIRARDILVSGPIPEYAVDAESGDVHVAILFDEGASRARAEGILAGVDGRITEERLFDRFRVLRAFVDRGAISHLGTHDQVEFVDLGPARKVPAGYATNEEHHVIELWYQPYLLSGVGFTVGMWEPGIPLLTHPEFYNRLQLGDFTTGNQDHATHIAGVLAGIGASPTEPTLSRGSAFQATIKAWDTDNIENELEDAVFEGIPVANNSWSYDIGWWYDPEPSGTAAPGWRNPGGQEVFGAYMSEARLYDEVIHDADVGGDTFLVVFPAGDDRNEGPGNDAHDGTWTPGYPDENPYFDCIDPNATGKNILTVGSTGRGELSEVITDYTCWGPTDDGRIKPDLVARGERVYSARVEGDVIYGNMSGSSIASASVAGGGMLVLDQYFRLNGARPSTAELKALLINGAEDRGPQGPDALYGFGFLNVQAAVNTVLFDSAQKTLIKTGTVTDDEIVSYPLYVSDGSEPLKLTLTWVDPPGSLVASDAIINDLDVRLISPFGATLHPFSLSAADPTLLASNSARNTIDTVEQIVVDNPQRGLWSVVIEGQDVSGSQKWAVVSNRRMNAGAPEPDVLLAKNVNGVGVDISWDPVADTDISEFRIHRTDAITLTLELIATVPGNATTYSDLAPPPGTVGYDVRAVYDRNGVTEMSLRIDGHHTLTPGLMTPTDGQVVPNTGPVYFRGYAQPNSTVRVYDGGVQMFETLTSPTGVWSREQGLGSFGMHSITVQAYGDDGESVSAPSVESTFEFVP